MSKSNKKSGTGEAAPARTANATNGSKNRSNGRRSGKGMPDGRPTSIGDIAFDIKAKTLPPAIEAAAMRSGDYPYDKKMKCADYEEDLRALQIELLKVLNWVKSESQRVVILFEGRDAAGKGGTITRLTQHLNPRYAHVVALGRPTDVERGQWYFQRYIDHLPTRGEMAIFDRSWYNRGGVEPVFGFCTPQETEQFLTEAPNFETMLTRDGIFLIKIFLSIGPEMQMKRLHARWHDPLQRWKLSDIDFQAIMKWRDYSAAFDHMLSRTDCAAAPWTIVRANDKRRTRLNVLRHILTVLPYTGKDVKALGTVDPRIVVSATTFLGHGGEED